eukprot:COSAG02_NODE_1335_length_13197_cov_5.830279_2_plen_1599_part_00
MVLLDPSGRDADFDWCLAFGEGAKRPPPPDSGFPTFDLPRTAFEWPSRGFTFAPQGHPFHNDEPLRRWGPDEWEKQGKWEALGWEERRGDLTQHDTVSVQLPEEDGFVRMLTQYMHKPWQCPVHTLKLALMKAGLEVEERMNDTYDVLFLLVRGDDEMLARQGQVLAEAGELSWKRTLVRAPEPHEAQVTQERIAQMGLGRCRGWNPCRDEYLETDMYNFTTSGEAPDKRAGSTWGFSMGMVDYDPDVKHCFEDRRLNHHLYTTSEAYDDSSGNSKKFPHPRYFHSGERQELVRAIMENVEWARYLPTAPNSSGDGSSEMKNLVYPNVRLTPHAKEETTCLMKTVAFGYPTEVTGSRRNQQMLGAMSFLRTPHSPAHSVAHADDPTKPWVGEVPSIKKIICGSGTAEEAEQLEALPGQQICSWAELDAEDKLQEDRDEKPVRRRLMVYPFMVDQCARLADQRNAKVRNIKDDDIRAVQDQQYALLKTNGRYELHHFKKDTFSGRDFKSLDDFKEYAAKKLGTADGHCPDKIREQQTFLVDCFPLDCPYERDYLKAEFASWKQLCSADVLSLPLDRIEGYYGSGAALYFAWLRCYTKALIIPGILGLALQLAVWSDGSFPGSVNVLQGWLIAYCMFCALWSSLFMLDWKRRQHQLQYRWGLHNVEENAKPRKEFLEKLQLQDEEKVVGEKDSCLRALWQCDQPVERINAMGKVEVDYSNNAMHYARQILTVLFVAIGAFIVIFTSLGVLLMRARGMNVLAGSASAWTSLSFIDDRLDLEGNVNDVYVEFWTVYDNSCFSLEDCTESADPSSDEGKVYGFAASKSNTTAGVSTQYTWRTSSEVIVRQIPKIVDGKALLVSGAAVSDVLLPACTGSEISQGLGRSCCTADDLDDLETSLRCWTEGKQKFVDGLAQDLGTAFVDVVEMDAPTLVKRVSDDLNFYFTHESLGDCADYDSLAACDESSCESCVYSYTSDNGEQKHEVFTSKRSTSEIAALPYVLLQGRQSSGELSEDVRSRLTAPQKLVFAEDNPFAAAIENGYCETLRSSNFRDTLRDDGVDIFSDDIGPQPLGHACLFADRSSLASYMSLSPHNIGLTDAYEFVDAVEPPAELPRRVPLYEPTCSDLEAFVIDSRLELDDANSDRNIKITTNDVQMYYADAPDNSEGVKHQATVWEAYRTVAPYIKTSVTLFSHEPADEDVAEPTHCEVYDADQIENECTVRRLTSRISCESGGGEWLGITSNKEAVDSAEDATSESALYSRVSDYSWGNAQVWGSTIISVLACQVYGVAWNVVANWLNSWENHRTQIEYEDFMIFKQFVFQFINYYFLLLYIAFLKSGAPFAPFMGEKAAAFGSTSGFSLGLNVQNNVVGVSDLGQVPIVSLRDTCTLDENDMPDCMSELCMQLITLMVFKAVFLQMMETFLPAITTKMSKNPDKPEFVVKQTIDGSGGEDHRDHSTWVHYYFKLPKYGNNAVGGCFADFNEMAIQFGFMSLFAVGFPGAAFFALVNNIQEMRADAHKIVCQHQRTPVELREDIGAWESVLSFISCVALQFPSLARHATTLLSSDSVPSGTLAQIHRCHHQRHHSWLHLSSNIRAVLRKRH